MLFVETVQAKNMPRESLFTFEPVERTLPRLIRKKRKPRLNMYPKHGVISIPKTVIEELGLANRYFKALIDVSKKAMAFKIVDGVALSALKSKEFRRLHISTTGQGVFSAKPIIRALNIKRNLTLELKKYQDEIYGEVWYVKVGKLWKNNEEIDIDDNHENT